MHVTQRSGTPRRRFHGDAIDPTAAQFIETRCTAIPLRVHDRSTIEIAPARKRLLVAVVVVLFAAFPPLIFAPVAGADDGQYEEFYTPPDPLPPGRPGDLI